MDGGNEFLFEISRGFLQIKNHDVVNGSLNTTYGP